MGVCDEKGTHSVSRAVVEDGKWLVEKWEVMVVNTTSTFAWIAA